MDSLRIRWGSDVISVTDSFALKSIARAAANFDEGKNSPLPFELTPGLVVPEAYSSQPFARKAAVPVHICDTTHSLIYDLTGLEFPAALRLKSATGLVEDILAVRAWFRVTTEDGGATTAQIVLDGYLISPTYELDHRYQAVLTDHVEEIEYRNIDASFTRVRPRVSSGWRAVTREVTWPLSADERDKAHKPRNYKKAELSFGSIAPKLLHQALRLLYVRGAASVRELSLALGVPEKQAAAFWKGLIADGIIERDSSGSWALNEGSQRDVERRKLRQLKRKEASALIEQLVKNAEAINRLPEGESSLYITGMEVLGPYLDINLDEFDYLYVSWNVEMRHTSRWPYLPDLENPRTGFEAVKAMLNPGEKRLKLIDHAEVCDIDCPSLSFFKFKVPASAVAAPDLSKVAVTSN